MDAIVVNNVSKLYKIPYEKKTTLFQKIIGLAKRQLSYEELWILKDLSFSVEKGETFGVIGRNGTGKTTLLKMLAKVIYPDSGSIFISGEVASFLEMGVGFQPELTAAENVYIYSSVMGKSRKEIKKSYHEIFEFAELEKFHNMKLKNYSSGMYMRLGFATASHANPDVLLIDEVFAVGDLPFQKTCVDKIHDFQEQGKTIVFVSHGLDTVRSLCRRALLINDSRIVSIGDTEKVIRDYHAMLSDQMPDIPSVPALISPEEGAMVYGASVNFQWNPYEGATKYMLGVSTSSDEYFFEAYFWLADVGNVLNYTVTGFPNDGTTYYWWVYAGVDAGWTLHCKAGLKGRSFTSGKAPPIPKR